MPEETPYATPHWTLESLSDHAALILHDAGTVYAIGASPQAFTLKALQDSRIAEDASVSHARYGRGLVVAVTAGDETTRLEADFDGGSVAVRYFRDNDLLLDERASILTGYSAPARKIAVDRRVYDRTPRLRALIEKLRGDFFFREQVLRGIGGLANPSGAGPIDYCDWVCKQCWHGMYLPHSCIACIFCNGFQIEQGGID